jgi:hypothetical protein
MVKKGRREYKTKERKQCWNNLHTVSSSATAKERDC